MSLYMTNTTLMRWTAIGLTMLALLLTMAGVLLAETPKSVGGGGCPCLPDDDATTSQAKSPEMKRAEAAYREALDHAETVYKQAVRDARAEYRETLKRVETDDRAAIEAELARLKQLPAPRVEPEPTPAEDAMNKRTLTVELEVPNGLWTVAIREVRLVGKELWILSELTQREGMGTMAITTVSDTVTVHLPDDAEAADRPVRHFITGKTWNWENEGEVTFIADADALGERWDAGEQLMIQADRD